VPLSSHSLGLSVSWSVRVTWSITLSLCCSVAHLLSQSVVLSLTHSVSWSCGLSASRSLLLSVSHFPLGLSVSCSFTLLFSRHGSRALSLSQSIHLSVSGSLSLSHLLPSGVIECIPSEHMTNIFLSIPLQKLIFSLSLNNSRKNNRCASPPLQQRMP